MKKLIIIIVIVAIISFSAYKITRKASAATQMDFDIGGVDIEVEGVLGVMEFLSSGADSTTELIISNYSQEQYKIENLNIKLYSLSDVLIGYQTEPLPNEFVIEPNSNSTLQIPLYYKGAMLMQLAKQLQLQNTTAIWETIQDYFTTGKFGTSIIVKGFAVVKGIKLPFEFEKAI